MYVCMYVCMCARYGLLKELIFLCDVSHHFMYVPYCFNSYHNAKNIHMYVCIFVKEIHIIPIEYISAYTYMNVCV